MEIWEKETVTCAEMKELERLGDAAGLSYSQMMENAGTKAAGVITDMLGAGRKAVVFCGKGNNGGDGFVIARRLMDQLWDVTAVLVEGNPVTHDAMQNYALLQDKLEITDLDSFCARLQRRPEFYDAAVDAVYGTGFHGTLREEGEKAVRAMADLRNSGAKVFAVDLPSGLPGDLAPSDVPGESVMADVTVTFQAKKPVHDAASVRTRLGDVIVKDIGIRTAIQRQKILG